MDLNKLPERFRSKFTVNKETGCWEWHGTILKPSGYGQYYVGGGQKNRVQTMAHRFAYQALVGGIPEEYTLDHLCRVRRCVNPAHLEPTTRGENTLRGLGPSAINRRKRHCKRGHPFDDENTYIAPNGSRACRECARLRNNGAYWRRYEWHHEYRHSERGKDVQRRYRETHREEIRQRYHERQARLKATAS